MATDDESAEGGALLATVLRLDRDGDHAGIASYLAGGNYDPANGVFAVYRLLTEGRFRSAHVAAKILAEAGARNPAVDLALVLGGALFGDEAGESFAIERLTRTMGLLGPDQRNAVEASIVAPAFRHALLAAIVERNGEREARLHRLRQTISPNADRRGDPSSVAATIPGIAFADPIDAALTPFWSAAEMTETLLFVRVNPHAPPQARLLFRPESPVRLTGARRDILFEPGRDYALDPESGVLALPKGSRIPFKTLKQLVAFAPAALPFPRDDPQALQFQQVEATYAHAPGQWRGHVPAIAEAQLPRTLKMLRAGLPLKLLVCGDSIAEGAGASGQAGLPPYLPVFVEQVAGGLRRRYASAVTLDNVARGGWSARTGAAQAIQDRLGARHPDLVIVAFGMNDITFANAADREAYGPANFGRYVQTIVQAIRGEARAAEFILVSPMFGNAESDLFPADYFPVYRDQLKRLVGPGVALADVTAIFEELLKTKSFFDVTMNGINHPNDFGHRIYAQTILALLAAP